MAGCAASFRRDTWGLMYKLTGETFVTLANKDSSACFLAESPHKD